MKLLKGLMKLVPALLAGAIWLSAAPSPAHATCQLGNGIQHVVYVEFDNVHFTRDNPNVPSDLEQMPNLLNFIEQNGTLDAGDHTVLISHTANDILTTQTGLYSDDTGIFIANSFGVFGPGEGLSSIYFPSSFFYWTDLVIRYHARHRGQHFRADHAVRPERTRAVGALHPRGMRRRRLLDRQHRSRACAFRRGQGLRRRDLPAGNGVQHQPEQ